MSNRTAMIAKIHIAKKDLALEDDSYRDLLRQVTGKDSSKACSGSELSRVLTRFQRLGWRPKRAKKKADQPPSRRPADKPQAYKIQALWSSLYLMCAVESREASAIAAFVRSKSGADDPRWATAQHLSDAIEAAKDMCKRAGFEPTADWHKKVNEWRVNGGLPKATFGHVAKILLVEVLWEKLIQTGCMKHGIHARLDTWLMGRGWPRSTHLLTAEQADTACEALGTWLRKERRKAAENAEA